MYQLFRVEFKTMSDTGWKFLAEVDSMSDAERVAQGLKGNLPGFVRAVRVCKYKLEEVYRDE
jgi:hypothetical protein